MADFADLPDGWIVWSDESDGRAVLAYHPDVFDAEAFPAPCLPTLYLTRGRRTARPGAGRRADHGWRVTFYLEPDVVLGDDGRFPSREEAVAHAVDLARRFDDGEVAYRECYQVPRERYLDALDELTGRGDAVGREA